MRLALTGLFFAVHVMAAECPPGEAGPQRIEARFRDLDRKAQVEFRHGDFAAASEDFHRAGCASPENLRAFFELLSSAAGALAGSDFSRAGDDLRRADAMRPEYPLALAMLVKAAVMASDSDGLKRCLLEAAHRFPVDSNLHAQLAQDLLHEKQNDLALAEELRAQQGGASGAKAILNLAVLENQAGAFGDAARLAMSVEQQAGLPEAMRASAAAIAGLSYEGSGDSTEATRHLKLAIEFDPKREQPYLHLARIYTAQQASSVSVDVLQRALKYAGSSPDLLLALGSALVAAERYAAAGRVLSGLVQSFPDQFEAYLKLAEAWRNAGEPGRATAALRELVRRKPEDAMLHTILAQSLLEEDKVDYAEVLHELAQAQRISPAVYDIYYLRGKTYLAMGTYQSAVDSLRRATELRPNETGAHYQLGLAYRKLGEPDLAAQQFAKLDFLRSNPAEPKARE